MADPALINLVARIIQDHFGTPLGDPARPHLLLSKREAVAREILDGLGMLGCVRLPVTPAGESPAGLQLDLLTRSLERPPAEPAEEEEAPVTKCRFCHHADAETQLPAPIGSADNRHPLEVCNTCGARIVEALFDLPWLRFVISRYVPPGPGAPRWEWLNQ